MSYRHTQSNPKVLLLFVVIAVVVVGAVLLIAREMPPPLWLVVMVLVFVACVTAVFSVLTVEVTDRELVLGFALGMMQRRIPRGDIVHAELTILPWWYGTGLKLGPRRTTYLVTSGPAVAVELTSGRILQIGSDDADALLAALNRSRV